MVIKGVILHALHSVKKTRTLRILGQKDMP
jgi:hypothetical protein